MIKIEVTTHSSDEKDIVLIDKYDVQELNKLRNDDTLESIVLGNNSYSRIDLKNIKVIDNDEEDV